MKYINTEQLWRHLPEDLIPNIVCLLCDSVASKAVTYHLFKGPL